MGNLAIGYYNEGLEEGIQKGIQQGIKQSTVSNTLALIKNGLDKKMLYETLKLDEDTIKLIEEELNKR